MSTSLPRPVTIVFHCGAAALLLAAGVDVVAVAGRHLGIPLLGSLEIVQALILIASSSALVCATVARKHAAVHILVDRVGPASRGWLQRCSALLCVIFLISLAAGSAWIASDLRGAHEQSELLHIPFAPLRVISCVALLMTAAAIGRAMLGRES